MFLGGLVWGEKLEEERGYSDVLMLVGWGCEVY